MLTDKNIETIIDRYTRRVEEFGIGHKALGWGKGGRQDIRYRVLSEICSISNCKSVLDVGCGFADYYDYLKMNGFEGKYVGVEVVPALAKIALAKCETDALIIVDDYSRVVSNENYDLAVASGLFGENNENIDMYEYIHFTLQKMIRNAKCVAVDFMSTYVDYKHEIGFHADPSIIIGIARRLTKRFTLRYDFMPYEYALYLYSDDSISANNVFNDCIRNVK